MSDKLRLDHAGTINYIQLIIKIMVVVYVFLFFGCAKKIMIIDKNEDLLNAPDKEEIFLVTDSGYIPLSMGRLSKVIKEYPITRAKIAVECTYRVVGEFTQVKKNKTLKFLNKSLINIRLLKLNEDNLALVRKTYLTGTKDEANFIEDKIEKIGETAEIRTVSLEAGEYAFVTKITILDSWISEPLIEPVFLFKVIEK